VASQLLRINEQDKEMERMDEEEWAEEKMDEVFP